VVLGGGRRNAHDSSSTWAFLDRYAAMSTELG